MTTIGDHAARFLSAVPFGNIVLSPDYGIGVSTRSLLRILGARARDANVPILVDPARGQSWSDYGRVTLIKANWAEATEAAGNDEVRPLALARRLADVHGCHVVVTIGCHGMVCAERDDATWYLPAKATDVRDVCRTGDTVLATLGVGLARGGSLREYCTFAVMNAAKQVSQPPTTQHPYYC
jgi:bifunctional ADP-heptose synthase (sugar kinase/adenylyltransferase)